MYRLPLTVSSKIVGGGAPNAQGKTMAQLARSKFLLLRFAEEVTFNAQAFIEGRLELFANSKLTAYSGVVQRDVQLTVEEARWLESLPESQWIELSEALRDDAPPVVRIQELIREGVVIVDTSADEVSGSDGTAPEETSPFELPEETVERFERHQTLDSIPWHPTSLYLHLTNQDAEVQNALKAEPLDLVIKTRDAEASANEFLDKHGEPPPAFFQAPQADSELIPLADGRRQGSIYHALSRRRTIRAFDPDRTVDRETLSTLLRYTFGCLGRHTLSPRFFSLHKGSPSGGSLHPIEAYPVVSRVQGLEPGFYHYDTRLHGLRQITACEAEPLAEQLTQLAQGQTFVAEAHFVVLLVARFQRNFWKYKKRINTFNVILKDAGHLSQTFQLIATDLGLGAFYTGAIDPFSILRSVGFDPAADRFHHGPIGILGAGFQAEDDQTLMPLEAYDPIQARDRSS